MRPNKVETAVEWFHICAQVFVRFFGHGNSIYEIGFILFFKSTLWFVYIDSFVHLLLAVIKFDSTSYPIYQIYIITNYK